MSTNPLPYVDFTDSACCSTQILFSTTWALFALNDELVSLHGICLGHTTNNIAEYSLVIKLLSDAITLGIWALVFKLESQHIVLQQTLFH